MRTVHKLALVIALAASAVAFGKSTRVRSHVRKDGTYVAPHRRTTPDSSRSNNWSTKSNTNPDTGKKGTKSPYSTPSRRR